MVRVSPDEGTHLFCTNNDLKPTNRQNECTLLSHSRVWLLLGVMIIMISLHFVGSSVFFYLNFGFLTLNLSIVG